MMTRQAIMTRKKRFVVATDGAGTEHESRTRSPHNMLKGKDEHAQLAHAHSTYMNSGIVSNLLLYVCMPLV